MEFCPFTLEDYIRNQPITPLLYLSRCWKEDASYWGGLITALAILLDISRGLEFIHGQKEVHRDLKPSNGEVGKIIQLTLSPVFFVDPELEDCGLRNYM